MKSQEEVISILKTLSTEFNQNKAMRNKWGKYKENSISNLETKCGEDPCICFHKQKSWGNFFDELTKTPLVKEDTKYTIDLTSKIDIRIRLLNNWTLISNKESLLSDKVIDLLHKLLCINKLSEPLNKRQNKYAVNIFAKAGKKDIASVLKQELNNKSTGNCLESIFRRLGIEEAVVIRLSDMVLKN